MKWLKIKIFELFHLELNSIYDYIRFKRNYSLSSAKCKDKKNLEAWILQDKHRIEKGLSLPNPRFFFGEAVLKRLVSHLEIYSEKYAKDRIYYFGVGSMKAYENFHINGQKELPEFFLSLKEKIDSADLDNPMCELVGLGDAELREGKDKEFFRDFSLSRHSCRDFQTDKVVTPETIENIMELSIKAPSVCNRQHWHVHYFSGEQKRKILSLQNGNTGFTDNIPYIAVITSDLRAFYTADERNQPFIDGGLFSMNLMYSMHAYGISSCALNWCNSFVTDHRFHKLGYIHKPETVIMILAFGYPNPKGHYAKSPRMEINNFYTINADYELES